MNIGSTPLRPAAASTPVRGSGLAWQFMAASAAISLIIALAALVLTVRSTNGFAVWSDGVAYFLYARSAVIDHDFDITNEFDYLDSRLPPDSKAIEPLRKWSKRGADGRIQPAWPVGAGLIMAPFYALGYAVESATAALQGRPPNSYGLIPQFAFALGCVAFGVLGLWCLILACREIVDERTAYLASFAVVLCGPVVFYVLFNPTMAHAISFGLIALLTLLWIRAWARGVTIRGFMAIGLILGIATTVRYQNALFGVLPAALALREWYGNGWRWAVGRAIPGMLACTLPLILLVARQLKPNSSPTGGGISIAQYPVDFTSPYFVDVLVSCRHGAFYWAPMLGVGLIGLLWALRRFNGWAAVLLGTLLLNVYLIGGLGLSTVAYANRQPPIGWLHHWDDAPSFGMRYLTECAPLFGLGLAFVMQRTMWFRSGRTAWAIAIAACASWNALLIVAYGLETISRSGCLAYTDMLAGYGEVFHRLARR